MISNSPVFGKLNQLSPEPPEGIELPLNAPRRVQVLRIMSLAGLTDGQQKPVARYSPRQKLCLMAQRFAIRLAGLSDAALIATQRARMFQEMGLMPEALLKPYRTRCEVRIHEMLERGEYIGWLTCPNESPDKIVAGVGVQRRSVLPHPTEGLGGEIGIAEGRHAIIINVFTDPDCRRRGLAKLLMEELIAWARAERLDRLVLHASDKGRLLYEKMGFVQTSEMRFDGRLDVPIEIQD